MLDATAQTGPSTTRNVWPRQRGGIFAKLLALILIVVLLAGLYLFRRPILRWAGGYWVVDEAPQASDAIFLLGDDNYLAERAARAAGLYHAGWAPKVVASGRWLRPYFSIAELMERDLSERGVPPGAIVRHANRAANTYEEALSLRRLRLRPAKLVAHPRRSEDIFLRDGRHGCRPLGSQPRGASTGPGRPLAFPASPGSGTGLHRKVAVL